MTGDDLSSVTALYDLAVAYDIAFDFRDLIAECDSLDAICQKFGSGVPKSFLDLACGPGYHCIEYSKRGLRSLALDNNASMLEYAGRKAAGVPARVEYVLADMRDFDLSAPVDLAFCAMSSFHHLLTNDDILANLACVGQSLTPGGIYVIEADHPRDVFGVGQSLKHEWESQRDNTIVHMRWRIPEDELDPITQIKQITVRVEMQREDAGERFAHEFVTPYRYLSRQELDLLVMASRVFEVAAWLGTLDAAIPMTNGRESNRMVAVLRRV